MSLSLTRCAGVAGIAALAAFSAPALPAAADDQGDPGVARTSVIAGEVDVQRADSGDTFAAAVNGPISPGDYLSALDDSRAEVEFDYASALRIAPDTQLRFTRLDPQNHQLQLAAGTVEIRVFRGLLSHPEVDTPAASIRPDTRGSYRISVTDDGNTLVTVRAGQADVSTQSSTQTIGPGASLLVTGGGGAAQMQTVAAVPYDAFDTFNNDRDAYIARANDGQYVDEGIVGADDLYAYGRWIDEPSYGQVWVPNDQAAGWAPYHDGRWVWEPYYGWTWVAYEPWGWAPYHYGNWFYANGTGWCWYPGAYAAARPYAYRPALVAFFSFGGGSGLSLTFGDVGWVPIAPFEPFHPWWGYGGSGWGYGGSTTIVNNTTIVNDSINNGNITKIYKNAGAPDGAVAVTNGNFSSGNFTHIQALKPGELRDVTPLRGVVPVVPTSHNLAVNGSHVAPIPSAPIVPGKFAHFAPPPAAPKSFALQRAAVASSAQKIYPGHAPLFVVKPLAPAGTSTGGTTPKYVAPARTGAAGTGTSTHTGTGAGAGTATGTATNPWSRFNNGSAGGSIAKPPTPEPAHGYAPFTTTTPHPYVRPSALKIETAHPEYVPPKTVTPKPYQPGPIRKSTSKAPAAHEKTHTPKPDK